MTKNSAHATSQTAVILLTGTVVGVVLVSALYWARLVLIPVALATFLTFLLTPLAKALEKYGLGRIPTIMTIVIATTSAMGGVGWLVAHQASQLVADLPTYAVNIKDKTKTLQNLGAGGGVQRLVTMLEKVSSELESESVHDPSGTDGARPPGVADHAGARRNSQFLRREQLSWMTSFPGYMGSILEGAGGIALALVLVIFMLLKREDLRDRFISLVGSGRMSFTTKAMDDAGQRISRYLVMQAIINGTYGLTLALGLLLIGVDYALLWGVLAAILRYMPYVGPWIAAIFPVTLSLAMFHGWWQPLVVIALFVVLEMASNNIMEPWLFGRSTGVSQVALLIAAALWAFIWGPVGLILSAPLTVCLVVLGQYVPQLRFLDVLLGDKPALGPDISYYQRLLARDQDDATHLVLSHVKSESSANVYDLILLPALNYARRDRVLEVLTDADEQFIQQATREILEDLGERQLSAAKPVTDVLSANNGPWPAPNVLHVLGSPGRDESDRLALEMLRQLLDPTLWAMEVTAVEAQSELLAARVAVLRPTLVCIGSLPPGGLAHTRYLCKRLRSRSPGVRIVVGRWGLTGDIKPNEEQLLEAGANAMTTTLLQTRDQLNALIPTLAADRVASSKPAKSSLSDASNSIA